MKKYIPLDTTTNRAWKGLNKTGKVLSRRLTGKLRVRISM